MRGVVVKKDVGLEDEDDEEGREFETTGEREMGEAVIGRAIDGPASRGCDRDDVNFECDDPGGGDMWGSSERRSDLEFRRRDPKFASLSSSTSAGSSIWDNDEERAGVRGSSGSALSKTERSVARLPNEGLGGVWIGGIFVGDSIRLLDKGGCS